MLAAEQKLHLTRALKELRLPAMREGYEEQAEQARREGLSYEQYLWELVEREREGRRHNRMARLLRESRLPLEKNLEAFDRTRLPRRVEAHLSVLLEGSFLDRAENVLAFGNPGSGKTHLLCALGQALIVEDPDQGAGAADPVHTVQPAGAGAARGPARPDAGPYAQAAAQV